jgi:hypothetical protein
MNLKALLPLLLFTAPFLQARPAMEKLRQRLLEKEKQMLEEASFWGPTPPRDK